MIDDFLPQPVLDALLAEFPGPEELDWHRFDTDQELKLAADDPEGMPPTARHLLAQFNSAAMIDFLEQLTGIQGLIPDPHCGAAASTRSSRVATSTSTPTSTGTSGCCSTDASTCCSTSTRTGRRTGAAASSCGTAT